MFISKDDATLILKKREYQRRWRIKKQMNAVRNKIAFAAKEKNTQELHSLIMTYGELLLAFESPPSHR
ncbi:hypothetical protein [Vibrio parahaemolyticus]|uniref:hypothetical protein n=1 Tax=Vibrio parahaemolyticus TaxID=670 RepID=UPI003891B15B